MSSRSAKRRTATAIVALAAARLLVWGVPFARWRRSLGYESDSDKIQLDDARLIAADVDWAARRLPFQMRCLPRAAALSWFLRRRRIAHAVVFGVRPATLRGQRDDLHAWVEVAGETIMGDLPGPWVQTLRLGP